jgi:hypothetical protein
MVLLSELYKPITSFKEDGRAMIDLLTLCNCFVSVNIAGRTRGRLFVVLINPASCVNEGEMLRSRELIESKRCWRVYVLTERTLEMRVFTSLPNKVDV